MSMNTPCNAQLQFWSVAQSSLRAIVEEMRRANKLKALEIKLQHATSEIGCAGPVTWDAVDKMVDKVMETKP